MKIVGITGTLGAGKGTVVDYLVTKYGFKHYSVRGYLREEAERQGYKEINRDVFTKLANELRSQHSPSYIIDELYKQAVENQQNAIIESVRTPGEVASLKAKGNFIFLAVDAKPEIRYERIVIRNSETDRISFEKFLADEKREMSTNDPNKQNLGACIAQADFCLMNDGDLDALYLQIDNIFR
ncbi:MAG: AAA family ATPase [Bacteroidales bacterium]|nr:AAA family ATPase [Bacteroidales bacterium]